MSFHVPEKNRITTGAFASSESNGNNGAFCFFKNNMQFFVIASDGEGWEHVSVSTKFRTPKWEEMCWIKNIFWDQEDCVVQFHPPESQYINMCETCLHLWKVAGVQYMMPDPRLVGI